MENDNSKYVPHWLLQTKNIILILIGILTAFNTYFAGRTREKLEAATKEIEIKIKQRQFENELRFKIFDEVKKVVTTDQPDKKIQAMIGVIMEEMLQEDSVFRRKMVNILLSSDIDTAAKSEIRVTEEFNAEQASLNMQPQQSSHNVAAYKIDVFYLDDVKDEAFPIAEKIKAKLDSKYSNKEYSIRLRLLPKTTNKKLGYQIDHNQIRYEKDEAIFAEEIMRLINGSKLLESEEIVLRPVRNKTPNYISVFIRNK
jgi:hypothetical protein